jgi:hypothetical protein
MELLVGLSIMLYPPILMTAVRIVMGPVYYTAFRIPFIFAVKCYFISSFQRGDSWCQIDVVGNQQGLS